MIGKSKKFDSATVMVAAKRSVEFWTTIDGNELARIGQNEKDMDLVGPRKMKKGLNWYNQNRVNQ
jgi:hypothetical protein